MGYKGLRTTALLAICVLAIFLSRAVTEEVRRDTLSMPVMGMSDWYIEIEDLAFSIDSIDSIEYREVIKTGGIKDESNSVMIHYYYKKPGYLRVEIKNGDNVTVDIYTPGGMYEYFPSSKSAYYREKWKDERPVSFQLQDKLKDILVRGKYETFKTAEEGNGKWEIIRAVDEEEGVIYEHRIWLSQIDSYKLPLKEEYFVDGEISRTHDYEYVLINKYIDDNFFKLEDGDGLKIYNSMGISKVVKDELEAEKYVNFNIHIPEYIPENYIIDEISIIPPVKSPSVLITYSYLGDNIYFNQKNTGINKLTAGELSRVITAGGVKFAIESQSEDTVSVRWVRDGIEYGVSGSYALKDEIKKIVHSISKVWVWIE